MDNEILKLMQELNIILVELKEALARNETEHKFILEKIEKLEKKENEGIKAIAWVASITGLILTIISILKFFVEAGK
jgi:cAMP phosphodiesterase